MILYNKIIIIINIMFYVGDFNLFLKEIVKHMWNIPAMVQKLSPYTSYTRTCKICSSSLKLFCQRQWNGTHGRDCKRFMDYIKENSPIITKFVWTVSRFYLLEVKHTLLNKQIFSTVTPCLCSMSNQFINAWFLL